MAEDQFAVLHGSFSTRIGNPFQFFKRQSLQLLN